MWSRFAIGLSAWLLGASAATAGSVYAVDQLGHDLLIQQSKQVSVSMVNSELTQESTEHKTPLPGVSPSVTPSVRHRRKHHWKVKVRPQPTATPTPSATPTTDPGQLLSSPDGTVVATCRSGLAYLVYVSPYNGFEVDDLFRGPARYARVTFEGQGSGIVMTVSCTAGKPHARISHDT